MDLVILAAGAGRRFGGLKQFEAVGPKGQCLYYYSVYDALKAGFTRIIFVVREDSDRSSITQSLSSFASFIEFEFVTQTLTVPEGTNMKKKGTTRIKPWGTTHALLQVTPKIYSMFAIVNSDDFYGYDAFKAMAVYLRTQREDPQAGAVLGYQLGRTLSENGPVNRGICEVDNRGYLSAITETLQILYSKGRGINVDRAGDQLPLSPDTTVSMNFWGFHPALLPKIELNFNSFIQTINDSSHDELCLATTVDNLIETGELKVKMVPTKADWFGMTYPEDLSLVRQKILELTQSGNYMTHSETNMVHA
jgi:hypothetical protein